MPVWLGGSMRGTCPGRFDAGSWAAPLQACSPYNELARNPACCILMLLVLIVLVVLQTFGHQMHLCQLSTSDFLLFQYCTNLDVVVQLCLWIKLAYRFFLYRLLSVILAQSNGTTTFSVYCTHVVVLLSCASGPSQPCTCSCPWYQLNQCHHNLQSQLFKYS